MADSETTSDQKTEEPTPRRLEKALEEGQIAYSSELVSGLVVLVGVLFFVAMGTWFFNAVMTTLRERLTYFQPMIEEKETILLALRRNLLQVAMACGGLMTLIVCISVSAGALQTKLNLTVKPLGLDLKKLNPLSGIKRVFSSRAVVKGLVTIAKAAAIIISAWLFTQSKFDQISNSGNLNLEQVIALGTQLILATGLVAAILMVIIGFADYAFQRWKQHQDLKMSLQEVRDEYKDIEGDPMLKARIRRLQNERSRNRMLKDVPKATVVITNPTHFAVALRYDPEENASPVVIAKGKDHLAFKIIEIAKENGVAVVERKPLARFMYANVDIGQPIPFELFQAVAEILNFIRKAENAAA